MTAAGGVADGVLYVDDGYTTDPDAHDLIQFRFEGDTFTMQLSHQGFDKGANGDSISTIVDSIRVLGLDLKADQVPDNADYDPQTHVLQMSNLNWDWTTLSLDGSYTIKFTK